MITALPTPPPSPPDRDAPGHGPPPPAAVTPVRDEEETTPPIELSAHAAQADMLARAGMPARAGSGQPGGRGEWRFGFRRNGASRPAPSRSQSDVDALASVQIAERDARIQSLERELETSTSTISELRSRLVRVQAASREERYEMQEKMRFVKEENKAFAMKVVSLEERLLKAEARGCADGKNGGGVGRIPDGPERDGDDGELGASASGDGDGDVDENFREEKIDDAPTVPPRPPPPTTTLPTADARAEPAAGQQKQRKVETTASSSGAVTIDAGYVSALRTQVDRCQKVIFRLDNELGSQREYACATEQKLWGEIATLNKEVERQKSELEAKSRQLSMVRHEARSELEDMAAKLECRESTVRSIYQKIVVGFEGSMDEGHYLEELRREIRDLKLKFDEAPALVGAGPQSETGDAPPTPKMSDVLREKEEELEWSELVSSGHAGDAYGDSSELMLGEVTLEEAEEKTSLKTEAQQRRLARELL